MDWISYWNGKPTVYVCQRHKETHYAAIANDMVHLVEKANAHVLDFGCGEALSADVIAKRCGRLYLCDAATTVTDALRCRYAGEPAITVLSPATLGDIPAGTLDLIVVNSVLQYISREQLRQKIEIWKPLLTPGGRIVFADIVPPDVGAASDAMALLRFGWREGFLANAFIGLARTALSDYRKLRTTLGLQSYTEADFIAMLAVYGLHAERIRPNLGHNQARMAFAARIAKV